MAEVTGIMVNSGTMMNAKCCGRILGLQSEHEAAMSFR